MLKITTLFARRKSAKRKPARTFDQVTADWTTRDWADLPVHHPRKD
jgi:hypothetical protein